MQKNNLIFYAFIYIIVVIVSLYFIGEEKNPQDINIMNQPIKIIEIKDSNNIMFPFFKTSKSDFLIPPNHDIFCNSFSPLEFKLLTA